MKGPKRWLHIILVSLVVVSLTVLAIGCKETVTTSTTQVTATAERGDISLDITAVGNLLYATEEELSFDTGGTIAEVLVDVGDSVTKDQVLAKLDMTEYQQSITDLDSALANKQQALTQAEQSLTTAQRNVTAKERAVTTAETALETAQYNLTVKERAVTSTQLSIENAELSLEKIQYEFETNTGGAWISDELTIAKKQLVLTKAGLDDANHNVAIAQNDITNAQVAIQDAQFAVEDANINVTIAQAKVESAQQDVANAQTALDEAKATSPEITAPFNGLITVINKPAGSTIYKGGAVVTIVDPDQFKADISVSETDILNVTLNGDATVTFDAIADVTLPAKVTSISPTATTTSGVVSYKVSVEIDSSPQALMPQSPQNSSDTSATNGTTPPAGFTPSADMTPPAGFTPGQSGGTTSLQSVQLRQGLTTTVSIIYQQALNAILIINQAITTKNDITTVQVIKDGVISERTITTGITNSKYTEVASGLSEGEQVVYYRAVSSATTTTTTGITQQRMFSGGESMPQGGAPPGAP